MKGTEELRQVMARYLTEQGVSAVCAWPERQRASDSPVTVVSLRSVEGDSPGFQDYLGERFDPELGQWVELYGKRVRLTFGLDVYGRTAHEVGLALDHTAECLGGGRPAGLYMLQFVGGETAYRQEDRRYHCPAHAVFEAWAFGCAREDGTFQDFEVRGEYKG